MYIYAYTHEVLEAVVLGADGAAVSTHLVELVTPQE